MLSQSSRMKKEIQKEHKLKGLLQEKSWKDGRLLQNWRVWCIKMKQQNIMQPANNEEIQKSVQKLVRVIINKLEENLRKDIRPGQMLAEIRILNNACQILEEMKYSGIQEIKDLRNKYFEYQNRVIKEK